MVTAGLQFSTGKLGAIFSRLLGVLHVRRELPHSAHKCLNALPGQEYFSHGGADTGKDQQKGSVPTVAWFCPWYQLCLWQVSHHEGVQLLLLCQWILFNFCSDHLHLEFLSSPESQCPFWHKGYTDLDNFLYIPCIGCIKTRISCF